MDDGIILGSNKSFRAGAQQNIAATYDIQKGLDYTYTHAVMPPTLKSR